MPSTLLLCNLTVFLKKLSIVGSSRPVRLNKKAHFSFSRAFSLFEFMLVACLLSLAGAVAAPNLVDWRSNIRLKGVASELKENLELARALAAMENTYIFVELLPSEGKYRLGYKDLNGIVVPIKEESLAPDVKIDSTHPKYSVTNDKTGFNSRGGADNCTIVITNHREKSKFISISVIGKIEVKN
jgi:Tfp pilus assembly protein FimT